MLKYLILGISFAFAAAVQPGPLQTYIISQTLKNGWRSTLPASFAPLLSDGPILILVLFLLSTIPENVINILRFGGGVFLFYLGYKTYRSWQEYDAEEAVSGGSGKQTLLSAAFVNLLNPAPYLGWSLIMGPLFLEGWKIAPAYGLALIIGFYVTMVLTIAAIIFLFSFAKKLGPKVTKSLLGISAIVLLIFGIYQFWQGIAYYAKI